MSCPLLVHSGHDEVYSLGPTTWLVGLFSLSHPPPTRTRSYCNLYIRANLLKPREMHTILFLFGLLAVQAHSRSLGSFKRADPTFVHSLSKRTDPYFHDGDFGQNDDGDSKRELLEDGVKDVYELVSTAL